MQSTKNALTHPQSVNVPSSTGRRLPAQTRLPNPAEDTSLKERLSMMFSLIFRTRSDASVIIGITASQIAHYIKGSFLPSLPVLYRLSQLGISSDWLLTESGTMFTNSEAGERLFKMVQRGDKLTMDDHFAAYFASQQKSDPVVSALPVSAKQSVPSDPLGLFGATA